MQSNESEFELTPGTLNTPSLMTPSILPHPMTYKPSYHETHTDYSTANDSSSVADSPSLATTVTTSATNSEPSTSSISSVDAKVSQIEDVLKQSLCETRRPTPSPFEKFASASKMSFPSAAEEGAATEIPSTADVVLALESLTNQPAGKYFTRTNPNENTEREVTGNTGDAVRYDGSPALNTSVIASPKKIFLLRSQSITDGSAAALNNNNNNYPTNNVSLSQKSTADIALSNTQNGLDGENSNDDSLHDQFGRGSQEMVFTNEMHSNHTQQLKSAMDNGSESNGIHLGTTKQPSAVVNNKRTYHQANNAQNPLLSKATTMIIPQQAMGSEVSSTDQSSGSKRQKIVSMPASTSVVNFRSAATASSSTVPPVITAALSPNESGGSDDQRKKQIRDSNREAARRCRERRRQYIEQLEGNLEQSKAQIKQLTDKLARVERENIQLRALISETKLGHSSRLSSNESIVEYVNVVNATGIELPSDSNHQTDGGMVQRNYISRNNL